MLMKNVKAVSLAALLAMSSVAANAHDDVRFSVSFGNAPVVYAAPVVYGAPVTYRAPTVVYPASQWTVTPINAYQPQVIYPAPVSYVNYSNHRGPRCYPRGHGRHHWD